MSIFADDAYLKMIGASIGALYEYTSRKSKKKDNVKFLGFVVNKNLMLLSSRGNKHRTFYKTNEISK